METKHTPGPWHPVLGFDETIRGIEAMHGPVKVNVINWNGISRASSENGQANARLISAAPELLEAAIGISKWFAMGKKRAPVESLRSAIAKATGNTI